MNAAVRGGDAERVAWVDTAKGLCIILVVMMHATLGVQDAMGGEGWLGTVVAFARPFRMPDFFLVSGLFLARVIDRDWRTYGDKRILHFVYFYLLWLVIQSAFKYGQVSGGSPAGFVEHLVFSLVEPYSSLWFIHMLAIFSVAAKLLRRVPALWLLAGAAILEILPVHTGWTAIDEFCARFVYFLAGWLLARPIFALAAWAKDNPRPALLGLALWAPVNGFLALTASGFEGHPSLASLPVIGLVLGGAGSMALITTAALLGASRLAAPFRYAGEHSIAIYLAFFLPMSASRIVLVKLGIIDDVGTVSLLVTTAAVVAPLVLERLVRKTPARFLFVRPQAFRLQPRPAIRLQPAE